MKNTNSTYLQNILHQKQIVQRYPPEIIDQFSYPTHHSTTKNYFFQELIFQQLEYTNIVEDYHSKENYCMEPQNEEMDIESPRIEEQQPYLELFPHAHNKYIISHKMLDSSGSERSLPARNSSISSSSENNDSEVVSSNLFHIHKAEVPSKKVYQKKNLKQQNQESSRVLIKNRRQVGSSAQKLDRINRIKKVQQIGCNCKKSKCLKMYCQCFNLQILCSEKCNCCGCQNMHQTDAHKKAVLDALTRNPKAFAQDAQQIPTVFNLGIELAQVKKGCKCKKTKCLKKYCECYFAGRQCGVFCQCQGCANCEPASEK